MYCTCITEPFQESAENGDMDINTSLDINPSGEILKLIEGAHREVLMCVYKLSDDSIVSALANVCASIVKYIRWTCTHIYTYIFTNTLYSI